MNATSLRSKLALLFVTTAVVAIIIAFVGILVTTSLIRAFSEVTQVDVPSLQALDRLKLVGSRLISSANESLLDSRLALDDLEEVGEVEEIIEEYEQAIVDYRTLVTELSPQDAEFLANISETGDTLVAKTREILALLETDASIQDIVELRESLEEDEENFLGTIDLALADMNRRVTESNESAFITATNGQSAVYIAVGLGLAITAVTLYYIARTVFPRLESLKATAQQISQRNWAVRNTLTTNDELGQFGAVFNEMAEAIEKQISETQAAREKAEESDRVKSAFLTNMSHELRTPLNSIINLTRFVVDGDVGTVNEQQKELLTDVVGNGKHLLSLINDILDMSKIESGSLTLAVETDVNMNAIIDNALSLTRGLLLGKPVRLLADIDDNLPTIRGDKQRILQALLNILSNACKFTDEGEINIQASKRGGSVLISISDTGRGIAQEDFGLVFEPFKQTTSGIEHGGGTGLGMPIAKRLVEAHGGTLTFESKDGHGTTFFISLPVEVESREAKSLLAS